MKIEPASSGVDQSLWIVYGDLPPAYLVTDAAPNPACALFEYSRLRRARVHAAREAVPVVGFMPVEDSSGTGELVPPTAAAADDLLKRLDGLQSLILDFHEEDLRSWRSSGA